MPSDNYVHCAAEQVWIGLIIWFTSRLAGCAAVSFEL
jgi:hypothetical protein